MNEEEKKKRNREMWIIIKRALIQIVRAIERQFDLPKEKI